MSDINIVSIEYKNDLKSREALISVIIDCILNKTIDVRNDGNATESKYKS